MKYTFSFISLIFHLIFLSSSAQDTISLNKSIKMYDPLFLGLGIGIINNYGDYGKDEMKSTIYNTFNYNLNLQFEKKISKNLGYSGSINTGIASMEDRNNSLNNKYKNYNFKSRINEAAVGIYIAPNLCKKAKYINPYFSTGIGYLKFNSKSDLKDAEGRSYFYWTDGTIRSEDENSTNAGTAKILQRDYNYETSIVSKSALFIPLTLGIEFKMSDRFKMRLTSNLHYSLTDEIDNIIENKNDYFFYSAVSVHYALKGLKKEEEELDFSGFDFTALDAKDGDNDNVKDFSDNCQNTYNNAKVDAKGCPEDVTDNDGIPDFKDKEPNTPKGANVDLDGIAIIVQQQTATNYNVKESKFVAKQNDSVTFNLLLPNVSDGDTIVVTNITKKKTFTIYGYSDNMTNEITDISNEDKISLNNISTRDYYIIPVVFDKTGIRINKTKFSGSQTEQRTDAEAIIFKVQLASSKELISVKDSKFKGITGINIEKEKDGTYKYLLGHFTEIDAAKQLEKEVKNKGIKDCFIVVFKNAKRLTGEEAIKLLRQ